MSAKSTFIAKAPGIMEKLLDDFPIEVDDAAAIVGNIGHECVGFTKLQEIAPVVKGSRGGYGWPQWTGPRRRAYEAYCKRNKLDPASDRANYAYLFVELTGPEKRAINAVKRGVNLASKVVAFENAFLRAGVKHYPSRQQYATWAIDAYRASRQKPAPIPPRKPTQPSVALPGPVEAGWLSKLFAAFFGLFARK